MSDPARPRDPVIAIDGPSGAGKGSVSRAIAKALGCRYVDTGAMYRAVAWMATHEGLALDDEPALAALAERVELTLDDQIVLVEGHDVTRAIRTAEIDAAAARVARMPAVREVLVRRQRAYAAAGGLVMLVMEGRDIGTTVFPAAQVKIYLDASVEVRARRRHDQLLESGSDIAYETVLKDLRRRDELDSTRDVAPLKPASDAVKLATDDLGLEAVVDRLEFLARGVPEKGDI